MQSGLELYRDTQTFWGRARKGHSAPVLDHDGFLVHLHADLLDVATQLPP